MSEEFKRDPESLLKVIQKQEENEKLGKLKIFLGMCPGVGKTYNMLESAISAIDEGKNVIVGIVETHGRKETEELLKKIPIFPLKEIEYRGNVYKELDLDGLLKLEVKPDLILVDELAHQNVSGSRHLKRYQDVDELILAGIDVYTTINIQHVESRNDQVAEITGIVVQETVPDSFFEETYEIELIDLSPTDLLKRLAEGKVYLNDRAQRARENFFRIERLTALRELALRFTAERVDHDLSEQMILKGIKGRWNTAERLLVAISHSPYSSNILRVTKRMAYLLDAPWIALYIDTGAKLNESDNKNLELNLKLAQELGAEVITIASFNIPKAIQIVCQDRDITQIIIGRPDRRFTDFFFGGTLLDKLVSMVNNVDIHVLKANNKRKFKKIGWPKLKFTTRFSAYLLTGVMVLGVSIFFYAILPYVGYQSLGSGFLLIILLMAAFTRRGPTIFAAISFALVWYFLFISSANSFSSSIFSNDSQDIVTAISFFITALIGGFLTARLRSGEELMAKRESRTALLYEFFREINETRNIKDILNTLVKTVDFLLDSKSYAVLADNSGKIESQIEKLEISDKYKSVANWSFEHSQKAGKFTNTLGGAGCIAYPIATESETSGVLLVLPPNELNKLAVEEDLLIDALAIQAAGSIQKTKFEAIASESKAYRLNEDMYKRILLVLSKKLFSPLERLVSITSKMLPTIGDKKESLCEVDNIARRLSRIAKNLVDLSSLENEGTGLALEKFNLQNLFDQIIEKMPPDMQAKIVCNIDSDIELIADSDLLANVFNNIIDNSLNNQSTAIKIEAKNANNELVLKFNDNGGGIPKGEEKTIFEKFYTSQIDQGGIGLGLPIVRKVLAMHGGSITVKNTNPGAVFKVTLPLNAKNL